ncbi:MAG: hypothetical protein F6K37_13260 [Moorea sp. SIO4E2]|uniref:hypothetical protein n=1 Tax=Moorena sp. SIO4E2 TaxID=2607826 RepID=UPI0013BA6978|nr:hypothetical protein [Moorena sp. SIO4E2]NEQ06865.1 hypothetical protein [Moorena sp. SIO4E2]
MRYKSLGFREQGAGSREQRCRGATRGEFNSPTEKAPLRSWGASAVLGGTPMSNWCGFPHERLHQDGSREEGRRIKSSVLDSDANCRSRLSIAKGIGNREGTKIITIDFGSLSPLVISII